MRTLSWSGAAPREVSRRGSSPSAVTASFSWTKHASHVTKPVRSTSTRPGRGCSASWVSQATSRPWARTAWRPCSSTHQVGAVFSPISRSPSLGVRRSGSRATDSTPSSSIVPARRAWRCEGAHVRDVLVADGAVQGVECTIDGVRMTLRAPLTIGADGRHGVVTRALGLDVPLRWPRRTGLVAHYRGVTGLGSWGEMHVAPHRRGYAGLAPLEEGLTNVAFVTASAAVADRPGSLEAFFERVYPAFRLLPPGSPGRSESAASAASDRWPIARARSSAMGSCWSGTPRASSIRSPARASTRRCAAPHCSRRSPTPRCGQVTSPRNDLRPIGAARRRAFWAKRQVCWLVQGFIATPALMDYATARLDRRPTAALTLAGVLGDLYPARQGLSPLFLARLLRP